MKDLTVEQKCIVMRNGMMLWFDSPVAEKVQTILKGLTEHKFITSPDGHSTFNTADITGVFIPREIEDWLHEKKNEIKCNWGRWHKDLDDCRCGYQQEKPWEPPC